LYGAIDCVVNAVKATPAGKEAITALSGLRVKGAVAGVTFAQSDGITVTSAEQAARRPAETILPISTPPGRKPSSISLATAMATRRS
jgi:hypothetical protein